MDNPLRGLGRTKTVVRQSVSGRALSGEHLVAKENGAGSGGGHGKRGNAGGGRSRGAGAAAFAAVKGLGVAPSNVEDEI